MRKIKILVWGLMTVLLLSACSNSETMESNQTETTTVSSEMFTDRDLEIGYDEEIGVYVTLSGDSASCDSNTVQISGSTVTITDEGTYILSGTLKDGMIIVNAEDTDKIQIVLDNVDINCSTSAAIYVLEADKVFITTASESENTLTNGGEYIAIDENNIDAVIFSKSDLTLNGAGTLVINAVAGHGIVSKDDLVLASGTYEITAASHGFSGKDSVRIASGTYVIDSGKDGVHAENTDDTDLGFLYILDGDFTITAEGDGMSASSYLQIEGGSFLITTGAGSASVTLTTDMMDFGWQNSLQSQITSEEDSVSQKGIKADGSISIEGGTFVIDTVDDSIHAGDNILISSGQFNLKTGDDAIHSDASVTIQNGDLTIAYCYEGIEGQSITVDDGTFDITSVDDGLNAAGGTDSSGFGGVSPEEEQFTTSSDTFITINGGNFVIVSTGDCIDSNGDLTINDGTLSLTCNGNGDTTIDCDGTYTNNGGSMTTNDGAENNRGQMGNSAPMGNNMK